MKLANEKKAADPVILDLRKVSTFCDFFIIFTGSSPTHIRALAEGIKEGLHKASVYLHHIEGVGDCRWVILDYSNVIVHIFDSETRSFYDLERLWADGARMRMPGAVKIAKSNKKRR
ncbi:MAG: ribosome silencing factor [Candidatus Omnitrophica bacterium]|nr:ribosome silencing factor [Candidatus Omnitrophota bacterium]MBU1925198.1 ribosome silencing factor [Candidatus Omnitrophota bacterium]MBU2063697.1 ribosome silencing factor [Candidatus Omnitrophota bacterium]